MNRTRTNAEAAEKDRTAKARRSEEKRIVFPRSSALVRVPQLEAVWEWLETEIFTLPSVDGARPLFNFYRDEHPAMDRAGAAEMRRLNLQRWLAGFEAPPQMLAVGEAPGWRGCRFTGTPFISEALLAGAAAPYSGECTSRLAKPVSEATATLFWRAFAPECGGVFTWNCVPLHPHRPGNPLSNRTPTPAEIRAYLPRLAGLVERLEPRVVLAVGRCAQAALREAGIPAHPVRHPSHGGAKEFARDVSRALLI
jgi:uracil-DNA glycosylase